MNTKRMKKREMDKWICSILKTSLLGQLPEHDDCLKWRVLHESHSLMGCLLSPHFDMCMCEPVWASLCMSIAFLLAIMMVCEHQITSGLEPHHQHDMKLVCGWWGNNLFDLDRFLLCCYCWRVRSLEEPPVFSLHYVQYSTDWHLSLVARLVFFN